MTKRARVFIAILLLFVLSSCSVLSEQSLPVPLETSSELDIESQKPGAAIALITTEQRLSSTSGQNVWNTLSRFSGEIGSSAVFYTANSDNIDGITSTLELAVKSGAELVITMDGIVTQNISTMSKEYPNVHFIFLDSSHDIILTQNAASITFSPEEAGWLSGYAVGSNAAESYACVYVHNDFSQRLALGYALGLDMATRAYIAPDTDYDIPLDEPSILSSLYSLTFSKLDDISPQQISEFFDTIPNGADFTFVAIPFSSYFSDAADTSLAGIEVAQWPQNNVVSNVIFDPRRILSDVLLLWHNDQFPKTQTFIGTIADGDLTINVMNMSDISMDISHIYKIEAVKSTIDSLLLTNENSETILLEELPLQHISYINSPSNTPEP